MNLIKLSEIIMNSIRLSEKTHESEELKPCSYMNGLSPEEKEKLKVRERMDEYYRKYR